MMTVNQRVDLIRKWIYEAATHIKTNMQQSLEVETKADHKDLVTNLDKETEVFFRKKITSHFPDEGILGEEKMGDTVTDLTGSVWIIDPIDGTSNFVLQRNNFAIMIAYFEDGIGQIGMIYNVMRDELVEATRGAGAKINGEPLKLRFNDLSLSQGLVAINSGLFVHDSFAIQELVEQAMGLRMYGAASLEFISVAKGETLVYASPHLQPWDIAAGSVIIDELGLKLTQMDGAPIDYLNPNAVFVGYPSAHQAFREQYDHHK